MGIIAERYADLLPILCKYTTNYQTVPGYSDPDDIMRAIGNYLGQAASEYPTYSRQKQQAYTESLMAVSPVLDNVPFGVYAYKRPLMEQLERTKTPATLDFEPAIKQAIFLFPQRIQALIMGEDYIQAVLIRTYDLTTDDWDDGLFSQLGAEMGDNTRLITIIGLAGLRVCVMNLRFRRGTWVYNDHPTCNLIFNAIAYLSQARLAKEAVGGMASHRKKRGKRRSRRPVFIDLASPTKSGLALRESTINRHTHMWWRMGHWRSQACGQGFKQRRPVWIEPTLCQARTEGERA